MASIQEIKRRIKAVTSTSQITKAMELVSATKMRKSQEVALLSRPYALEALRILGELTYRTNYLPQLMMPREVKTHAVVLVASDRGLAGAFNANVFRAFEKWVTKRDTKLRKYENDIFIAVGKKAKEYLERNGFSVAHSYLDFGDYIEVDEVKPLTDELVKGYLALRWDKVTMISMHFRSTLRQEVLVQELLPISVESVRRAVRDVIPEYGRYSGNREEGFGSLTFDAVLDFEYLIEPEPQIVLDAIAPKLLEIVLYDVILEANASEHSARMVAMKNASENASELKGELTLEYNKSRQANITRELAEIVGGAEALQG